MTKARRDLHQEVTDSIIKSLEQGVAPWVKSWSGGKATCGMPFNGKTGRRYKGINVVILWAAGAAKSYSDNRWYGFGQAKTLGGRVRKGEKATHGVKWVVREKKQGDKGFTGNPDRDKVMFPSGFTVFNHEQIDWPDTPPAPTADDPQVVPVEQPRAEGATAVQVLADASGARVTYGHAHACYHPSRDCIEMPAREQFQSNGDYASTLAHKLVHWTGAHNRCNRQFSDRFGTEAYAAEELVAELGAAFICAACGVQGNLQHPEYIANWLKVLRNDKKAIFTAVSKASQAVEWLEEPRAQVDVLVA